MCIRDRWEADRLLLDYAVLEAGCRGADQVAEASAALLESLRKMCIRDSHSVGQEGEHA